MPGEKLKKKQLATLKRLRLSLIYNHMKINYTMTGIAISCGINFFLLYTRKQRWNSDLFRWLLTSICFTIGIAGLLDFIHIKDNDFPYFSWCLTSPLFYNILDRSFKKISKKMHKRDFHLWLRGSFEIDDSIFGQNPHVRGSDILFSIILLIVILLLPLLGI